MGILVRVFTHPACSGCGEAVQAAWEIHGQLEQKFELRTVTLEQKDGLAEAHREGIKTIPTVIVTVNGEESARQVGSAPRDWLLAAIQPHLQGART